MPGGAQVGMGGCPPLTITVPQPPATSTAGFGALWPCQQGDAMASWTPRLGSPEPSVAPLPQILPERWQSLSAFIPPPPAARHPTPGSPRGYLTPSLSSSFLRAGGRSAASHIPKETVGSFEKVGLALGCLFIAPRARRSHASVPQRSCTGLFIFPLLRFPLGRPSQECRWYCRHGEVEEDLGPSITRDVGAQARRSLLRARWGWPCRGGRLGVCHCLIQWGWGGLGCPPTPNPGSLWRWEAVEPGGCPAGSPLAFLPLLGRRHPREPCVGLAK